VADWLILEAGEPADTDELLSRFGLPVVIKPVREGSSLGLTLATTREELDNGIERAQRHDSLVMIERYIRGRELTVGVIGNRELTPLPVIEIIPGDEFTFFDYDAKYKAGASKEICPAEIEDELKERVQEYGVSAHKALRLRGYSRTDMIVTEEGQVCLLETNTIPGMTPTSLLPQAAAEYGLDFPRFLEHLISLGMEGKE
jgi:D-alanine-D-alanine ligase